MPTPFLERRSQRRWAALGLILGLGSAACQPQADSAGTFSPADSSAVVAEVEAAVWAFHAADTARDAEGVINLLWPQYYMFADGQRAGYEDVVTSSREFMQALEVFHTVWSDVRVIPISRDAAVSSFVFRDSIVTLDGQLIQARGPTTFLWERRGVEWRASFGDSDHYPIEP